MAEFTTEAEMGVERLELERSIHKDGQVFGPAGEFEELKGRAHIALDPGNASDRLVTDLELAPLDADGLVRFDADIVILRPIDGTRSNRRLLLDAVNRGNPVLRSLGEDWVLSQGFTVVRVGWQHDVPRDTGMGLGWVEAKMDGRPIQGVMARVFEPDAPATTFSLGENSLIPYRADPDSAASATLTEREYLGGPPEVLPRDAWRFARVEGDALVEDFSSVFYEPGFKPGHAYELIFTATGAPLTGHGLAATRDVVSFLRFASAEEGNPLAGQIDTAIAFGASQSGRFLRQMLYDGFCADREGRLIFEGLLPHTGGGRLLEANWRFGQPGYNGWDAVSATFPFTDSVQTDPITAVTDGIMARALNSGRLPKVIYTNSSAEYWGGQVGSLVHVSADGTRDADIPDNVRIYHFAGTQHGVAPIDPPTGGRGPRGAYPANTIDYRPLLRAAFDNLNRWVDGVEPPPSSYGRIDNGTLVERESAAASLAMLPGAGVPKRLAELHRLDFGPDSRETRRLSQVPPRLGAKLALHVSQVDADGNEVAGVRHPDVAVPLATYTGWNPRHANIGGEDQNLRTAGSTIAFARTRSEREAAGDSRPSVEERYSSRDSYLEAIRAAANELVSRRLMLAEDVEEVVAYSARRYDKVMTE